MSHTYEISFKVQNESEDARDVVKDISDRLDRSGEFINPHRIKAVKVPAPDISVNTLSEERVRAIIREETAPKPTQGSLRYNMDKKINEVLDWVPVE